MGNEWKPMDRAVSIVMRDDVWQRIKEIARPAGYRSANDFVRGAISREMERVEAEVAA